MKLKNLLELTPLIDVFLILLFVFMINQKEGEQAFETEKNQIEGELKASLEKLADQQQKSLAYESSLDESERKIKMYEQELLAQKELLEKSTAEISRKLMDLFGQTSYSLENKVLDGELTPDFYYQYLDQLQNTDIVDSTKIIQQIMVLGELKAYSTIINIYVNNNNQVLINGKTLSISLGEFDENTGDFAPEMKESFETGLKNELENHYEVQKKSREKLGEIVMITFGHAEKTLTGVIKLTDSISRAFYSETRQIEGNSKKIFYSNLGYFPFL
ncbi:hypothetical protein [Flexithrix dorotheae]|uniref:hypothetical protein n=1 Tax=Flexithrix dorotheae TaxID=70993 RepID=UPI0003613772|nr:hypothetical protein [Flexithrix dorotheae]